MTEQLAEPAVAPQGEAQTESVRDAFARVYADGKAYASAELDRQKLRVGVVGAGVRNALIFASVAIMLVFASLVAFLIGLVIALAPRLGPLWATVAVFAAALCVALCLLLLAKARIGRMKRAIAP